MKENIYIDLDEDIQSVIQKINSSETENLDLVVPTGARILQNIVDAHLIKEAGDEVGKNLTIVTSDLMGRIFAERAGLAVSGQTGGAGLAVTPAVVGSGRISDIVARKRGIPVSAESKKNIPKLAGAKSAAVSAKLSAKGLSAKKSENFLKNKSKGEIGAGFLKSYREERSKVSVFNELGHINRNRKFWPFKLSPAIFVGGTVLVALVLGFVVFGRTLPRADVIIYPVRETRGETVEILISGSASRADFGKNVIPGELLTLEKSLNGEFTATGAQDVSGKARGKITIYNAYSSQAQNFVASRFQAENGKIFWTTKSVSVPGYTKKDGKIIPGQTQAELVAAEAGDSYNVGPSKFTMPALKGTARGDKIYAVSDSPIIGGGSDGSKIVSNDDATKAYNELKEKIRPQFNGFKNDLPAGFQLWSEAYNEELADSSVSPEVGGAADKFTATVKMVARAVVFKTEDLESYMNTKIGANLEENKLLLAGSKEISFLKPPVVDYQKGTVLATLNIKYDTINKFDTEEFKKSILKKKEKEIKSILLSYKDVERVEVGMWPFWVRSVPANNDRVKISIKGL
ncbi:MAG: hypothetical protein HYV54_01955 [Parcubacteria group bacterium]|nr:hypothetical protein [Parcubacteria group bacterium]